MANRQWPATRNRQPIGDGEGRIADTEWPRMRVSAGGRVGLRSHGPEARAVRRPECPTAGVAREPGTGSPGVRESGSPGVREPESGNREARKPGGPEIWGRGRPEVGKSAGPGGPEIRRSGSVESPGVGVTGVFGVFGVFGMVRPSPLSRVSNRALCGGDGCGRVGNECQRESKRVKESQSESKRVKGVKECQRVWERAGEPAEMHALEGVRQVQRARPVKRV
jgi:hypothetical protein